MGINYFVFAVNKMDLVGYDEKRFDEINLSNPLILEISLPLSSFHAACRLVVYDTGGSL